MMLNQIKIITDIDGFIDDLFSFAIKKRASDIHIQPEVDFAKIRLRIDGKLKDYLILDRDKYERLTTKIKLLCQMDLSEKRLPQDKAFKLEKFSGVDFRVASLATVSGEKLVIRVLSIKQFKNKIKLLGFSQDSKDKLVRVLEKNSGMLIFSGPTGSGKSTSLYALLEKLNREEVNIISIEDPVEYKIENINQISINEKIGLTYPKVLRAILRQDPDIIMIGEIRDKETASIAIRAAITGHLILSTTHSRDALSALVRLKDLGIEEYLIRSAVSCLASQRLVRKLCSCKQESSMTDFEYEFISKYVKVPRDHKIYRAVGCPKCNQGYLDRQAVEEVIILDDEFKEILKNHGFESKKIYEKLKKDKFRPMITNGLVQVLMGETTLEEVLKAVEY